MRSLRESAWQWGRRSKVLSMADGTAKEAWESGKAAGQPGGYGAFNAGEEAWKGAQARAKGTPDEEKVEAPV